MDNLTKLPAHKKKNAHVKNCNVNPLTAHPDYILFFIKYQLLNMSNIKRDIKQQDFTKSPFCQTLIIFTHLQ